MVGIRFENQMQQISKMGMVDLFVAGNKGIQSCSNSC
jgi:hypothetical protein